MTLRGYDRKSRYKLDTNSTSVTLVGDAGIKAAVRDDEFPFCKGWKYDLGKMLGTVGLKKEGFRQRRNGQFRTSEQELANLNAKWCSSWFAGTHVWNVLRL